MTQKVFKITAGIGIFTAIQLPAFLALGLKEEENCLLEENYSRVLIFSSLLIDIHAIFWTILFRSNQLSFDESTFLLGQKPLSRFLALSIPLLGFSLYVLNDLFEIFLLRRPCHAELAASLAMITSIAFNSFLTLVVFIMFCIWLRAIIARRFTRVIATAIFLATIFIVIACWGFSVQRFGSEEECVNVQSWFNISLFNSIALFGGAWAYPLVYDWQGSRGLFNKKFIASMVILTLFNLVWGVLDSYWLARSDGPIANPDIIFECFQSLPGFSAFLVFSKVPTFTILCGSSFLVLWIGSYLVRFGFLQIIGKVNLKGVSDAVENAIKGNSAIRIEKIHQTDPETHPNMPECSICMEGIGVEQEHAVIKDCGHRYHKNCILDWLKQSPNCPICRITVRS